MAAHLRDKTSVLPKSVNDAVLICSTAVYDLSCPNVKRRTNGPRGSFMSMRIGLGYSELVDGTLRIVWSDSLLIRRLLLDINFQEL